jgi:hypothetical protein
MKKRRRRCRRLFMIQSTVSLLARSFVFIALQQLRSGAVGGRLDWRSAVVEKN